MNVLDFFARLKTPFLHAHGKAFTHQLISLLNPQPGELILDFGCGTGASLVLAQTYAPESRFMGVDKSLHMIASARQRIAFCGFADTISVHLIDHWDSQAYHNQFDKIYVESVLAIQSTEDLWSLLQQIYLLLKPKGKLIINETLWLPDTPQETLQHINRQAKEAWGIIQSNSDYPTAAHWKSLLEQCKFEVLNLIEKIPASTLDGNKIAMKSDEFSRKAKAKTLLNPLFLFQYFQLKRVGKKMLKGYPELMKGYLFELQK